MTHRPEHITSHLERDKGLSPSVASNIAFNQRDKVAVERGHQDGIAHFVRLAPLFGLLQPQIIGGFLQMLTPFVNQWLKLSVIIDAASDGKD